jgi:uncharacterized lipoprotein YmbA
MCLLCACATSRPDHFYILSPEPPSGGPASTSRSTLATIKVSLPSLVDRAEIVLNTSSDAVSVPEHERWGAPLVDLVSQTLAQDIERRRGDVLVAGVGLGVTQASPIKMTVNIVQVWMRRGEPARIEVQWRIRGPQPGKESSGTEAFSAPLGADGYAAVAQAWSACVALLADRLAGQIPRAE